MSEFVDWCQEAKEPSKEGANEKSGEEIPEEELEDAVFAGFTLLPGDFGM